MAIQSEYAPWDGKWLRYDWFKLLVLLLLLLLIMIRLASGAPVAAVPVTPTLIAPTVVELTIQAPVLISPASGAILTAGPVTLTGEATPGSLVQVLIDGKPAGTVNVDASGVWSLQTMFEQEGPRELVAQAIQADGTPRVAAAPRTVLVALPPAALTLDLASSMPAGEIVISGAGEPGATIEVLVDGQAVGQTQVDSAGRWALARTLDAGQRQIVARNIDSAGQAGSGTVPVAVTIRAAPAIMTPRDGAQLSAGRLTIEGTGQPGDIVEIRDGDRAFGSAVVGADGTWSFAYDAPAGQLRLNLGVQGQAAAIGPMIAVTVVSSPASSDSGTAATGDTAMIPAALPNTAGADIPWGAVLLLALALLAGGALVRWWARQRTREG